MMEYQILETIEEVIEKIFLALMPCRIHDEEGERECVALLRDIIESGSVQDREARNILIRLLRRVQ
jgi:hypothetical protein